MDNDDGLFQLPLIPNHSHSHQAAIQTLKSIPELRFPIFFFFTYFDREEETPDHKSTTLSINHTLLSSWKLQNGGQKAVIF